MVGLRLKIYGLALWAITLALLFLSSRRVLLTRAFDEILTLTLHELYSLLSTQSHVDNTDIISC